MVENNVLTVSKFEEIQKLCMEDIISDIQSFDYYPIYSGSHLRWDTEHYINLEENTYYYVKDLFHNGTAIPLSDVDYQELYDDCIIVFEEKQSIGNTTYFDDYINISDIDISIQEQLIELFGSDKVSEADKDNSVNFLLDTLLFKYVFKEIYKKLR